MSVATGPLHALAPCLPAERAQVPMLCYGCTNAMSESSVLCKQPSNRFELISVLCSCRAVANLAVALLSLEESETRLLDFLARARNPMGKPLFDPKYALRLAKDRNR